MRTSTSLALTAALALSVAGCSLPFTGGANPAPSDPPAPAPASSPAAVPSDAPTAVAPSDPAAPSDQASVATPSESGTDPSAVPSPADPSQSAAGTQLGAPVATREAGKGGGKIQLTLYPVLRDGTTSHVNLALKVPAGTDKVQLDALLSDGNNDAGDSGPWAADGIQLIDGKNSKLYLVASDGQKQCLCSRNLVGVFADTTPLMISATFAAPPANVTKVDVRIPAFGTVTNVPVQ
jgi:hypothetical protein